LTSRDILYSLKDQLYTSKDASNANYQRTDFDDTEERAHGRQEQVRYDSSDGGSCFLPLPLYEGRSGRRITAIFKAKRFSGAQRLAVWKRLGKPLRHAWPDTVLSVRGDSHFAYPEVRAWIEAQPNLS
jgi:hypothetical protein